MSVFKSYNTLQQYQQTIHIKYNGSIILRKQSPNGWWRTLPTIFFYASNWVDDFLLAIMKEKRKPECFSLFRRHFFRRDILSHKIFIHILQF